MPMTLNVGLSKKVGEPDYGSRGASVNLETELDAGLVNDPDRLRDRIRQLFQLARSAVHEELSPNGHQHPANGNAGTGPANGNANGNGARAATDSQVRALHAIARKRQLDLSQLVRDRFNCQRPEDLSLRDASTLIDELDGAANGSRR